MRINKNENKLIHAVLFTNWENYKKWAPRLKEFVRKMIEEKKVLNGTIPASFYGTSDLHVNDMCWNEFEKWIISTGVC